MVHRFNSLWQYYLDLTCPTKTIRVSNLDGKFHSPAIKQACRRKNREYEKNGNSQKYKELKWILKSTIKDETRKFLNKQTENISSGNNSWKHIKNLTLRPGDARENSLSLPQHVAANLSPTECADRICQYFHSCQQELETVCVC